MNTKKLIEKELFRIKKEIGEIMNSGCEESKEELIAEAVKKYELTNEEKIRLMVMLG